MALERDALDDKHQFRCKRVGREGSVTKIWLTESKAALTGYGRSYFCGLNARLKKVNVTPGACKPAFSLLLGAWRTIAGYEAIHMIRKGRECGGCEGRSTAPLHSRSVRGVELNCRSSTQIFASTTNLQHRPKGRQSYCESSQDRENRRW
jgi:hypothetical protein